MLLIPARRKRSYGYFLRTTGKVPAGATRPFAYLIILYSCLQPPGKCHTATQNGKHTLLTVRLKIRHHVQRSRVAPYPCVYYCSAREDGVLTFRDFCVVQKQNSFLVKRLPEGPIFSKEPVCLFHCLNTLHDVSFDMCTCAFSLRILRASNDLGQSP